MTTTLAPATYRLRPITPQDRVGLSQFYADLSADSRAARFHGCSPTIPEATATFFCGSDHLHREGILAESCGGGGDPAIIGHLCIEPIDDHTAEIAIAIADAWQHHGVGREMLCNAITWAQAHGVTRLVASMQGGNSAMFVLLRSVAYPIAYGSSIGGTTDAYLDVRRVCPVAA